MGDLPGHMQLFFIGLAAIGLIGALEKLARQRWGLVLGIPIANLVEEYAGELGNPREVDLDPHLYDVGRVEWLTDTRLLLIPARGEVHMHAHAGTRTTSRATGFMCIGDLHIDPRAGILHFRTRVLVRIVPLLGALLFVLGPYVPDPWGMDWPLPGRGPLWLAVWPFVLFGGFFVFTTARARTAVITAHHAVTAAFMTGLPAPEDPTKI
jgi:hypothetical protein